jgi:hypothetical protein
LAVSGSLLVTGLAGCAGGSESGSSTNGDGTAETVEPSAEVVGSNVFEAPFFSDGTGDNVPYLRIDVENSTDTLHREVSVETRFRDENGDILATREHSTAVIPAGATWRTYSQHSFDMSSFDEAEHTITDQKVGTRGNLVDDFEILNANMDFDNASGVVSLTGEIELGNSDIGDLVIVPLIYDAEDRFRGAFRILEENSQETIAFDGGLTGFGTPSGRSNPDDYEIIIAEPLL